MEGERSRIRAVQIDNLRGLLDRVPSSRIRELFRMTKGVNEKIDENVGRWFGHIERIRNNSIARKV